MSVLDQMDFARLYTVPEAARLIGIHPVTLRDWIRADKFPAFRVGRQLRIDPGSIADWLESRRI